MCIRDRGVTTLATIAIVFSATWCAAQTQNVTWINMAKVSVSGNAITKTSGCNPCPDAGGSSQQTISAISSFAQFTVSVTGPSGPSVAIGLATSPVTPPVANQINYSFDIWPDNTWGVREFGTYRTDGTFASGQTFKIAIEAGPLVKYYVGSTLVWTSATPPSGSYLLAAVIYNVGESVNGA